MLRYCLFLRSAPHHSEAIIPRCTVSVLPMIYAGATKLHVKPDSVDMNKQSNRRARIEVWEEIVGWRRRRVGRVRRSRHPATEGKVICDADAGSSVRRQSRTARSKSTAASSRCARKA
ncbi:hypothetical protein C6A45_06095 [Enterobacter hormaechei]|nr:hypothetical protein AM451_19400 [Enterobacter cloacae complex sp.]RAY50647.1 hypothetical protein DP193_01095 [Enterobacter hormaechei subsp. oharae]RCA16455.1 hypothetical protein C6A45_06095 [Enterobacter hormaechei]RAY63682.1 hypothetical protein DP200_06395 [Enterobacter hormaechei subsp. oharae]TXV36266.1 hypothetical protein D4M74_02625 [Enterobacter hormaechei]